MSNATAAPGEGAIPSAKGLRVADMNQSGKGQDQAIERAPGIYESRGIGNSYLITTPGGDVLVNAGTLGDAKRGKALFARVSSNPIKFIVLTQSHANQYGGLEVYKTPATEVIAHRNYQQERADSQMLDAHYRRGSRRIFATITGRVEDMVPTCEVPPDRLLDGNHSFTLGGRRFELIWTPGGEARSAMIVWLPDDKIAIVGNLFGPLFGNHPNLNTLRGDKPRSAAEFIASAKIVRELGAELILTGHEEIRGAANIEQALTRIIDSVQWVFDRTIEGMNAGIPLSTLMHEIKPPPELTLTEEYGKLAWNVRAIWHEYTGWFDPARGTTELYGVGRDAIAGALVELAGNTERMTERAQQFVADERPLEALHMLDIILAVKPDFEHGRAVKREALTLLLKQSNAANLWERMWIAAELRELES